MFVIYVLPCCSSTSDAPRDSKLLNILHDARSTLSSTGRTMQKQGQQIDSACAISRLLPASKISSDFFDSTKVPGKCFSLEVLAYTTEYSAFSISMLSSGTSICI